MNLKRNFKRILSGVMSVAMAATLLPSLPAVAEEAAEKYPYTMFAASDTEGSITINANNFCVNGNIATNGTIVSNGNLNPGIRSLGRPGRRCLGQKAGKPGDRSSGRAGEPAKRNAG